VLLHLKTREIDDGWFEMKILLSIKGFFDKL
jgi:hypothetical protein